MSADPARLYTLLMNTGLQTKDNPTYQVIRDLIGHIISVNQSISSSASGNVGQQGIQGIQGLPGLDGISGDSSSDNFTNPIFPIPIPPLFGGTGLNSFTVGDMLYADSSSTLAKLAMAPGGSILISTTGPGAPRWATSVVLGAAGTGILTINGRLGIVNTQLDDANQTVNLQATFPSVITTTRTAFNFQATTAGSSAFITQGLVFTMAAGYTGTAAVKTMLCQSNVASAGFVVGVTARMVGASAINIGVNSFCDTSATQNIALFGGLGNTDGSNFSSAISACAVLANGTTTKDFIQCYSNATKNFSVTDSGVVTAANSIISNGGNIQIQTSRYLVWNGQAIIQSPADSQLILFNSGVATGVGLDFATDGVLKFRNRGQNADAAVGFSSFTHSLAEIDSTAVVYAPVTGATITMNAGQSRAIINPLGLIAALTITLPPTPVNNQVAGFSFTQAVTVLTVNAPGGATVVASPTSAAIDTNLRFIYQSSSTSWFPAS